jgi:glutamine synthetase
LGDDLTQFLEAFKANKVKEYKPAKKMLSVGVSALPPIEVPSEDRNRTSPFPMNSHRFEFRAVGSSQNVSFVNTVLNTITADAFGRFADAIEKGQTPQEVAIAALNESWKIIFNGNGYDKKWHEEAEARGLLRLDSGVEAINRLKEPKNVELFQKHAVLSPLETEARRQVLFGHYTGTVEMEANCMVDMIHQQVIPAMSEAGHNVFELRTAAKSVAEKLCSVHHETCSYKKAQAARELRLETLEQAREVCDAAEAVCPEDLWPMATYRQLLFLDANQDAQGNTLDPLP